MRIIAGEARGRRIHTPPGRGTRPPLDQVRGSIFSILEDRVEDAAVLDLFAGSGAFGLEAISRGARSATFVESDRTALEALARNLRELGFLARSQIIQGDALYRPSAGGPYDLIFIDPPYAMFEGPETTWAVITRVDALVENALRPGGSLLLRHPPKYRLAPKRKPADLRTFGNTTVLFFENT